MSGRSDGYVTDVQYTSNFYPHLAPGFLAFACLRQGVRPPKLGAGAAYLELGCGQGFGLNLLAAANPDMQFHGVDFHAGQIANARRLAGAAGLANVTFDDLSFGEMLDLPAGRLPAFDVIVMHGIWSWVSAEVRGQIVQLLDRLLKPGGMVYVSYNCLPGWAPRMPLQRFVAEHVARHPGDPQVRVVEAFHAALQLIDAGAAYFEDAPALRARIEDALRRKPAYLVHEYLNGNSAPAYHADVARDLAPAGLAFAASCGLGEDQINLAAPARLQQQIFEAEDAVWRETLLDYASSKPFRRDIFVRKAERLSEEARMAALNDTRFALIGAAAGPFEFDIPMGVLTGEPAAYQGIVDALVDGPRSYAELAQLPPFRVTPPARLLKAVTLLVGGQRIHPVPESDGGPAAARDFNRTLVERTGAGEPPRHLAAPLVGTGVAIDSPALAALAQNQPLPEPRAALLRQLGAV